ncbi:MAG: hypothetical protein IJ319_05030 [Bacteroidaceae bacterium]|nr:hypothetical protein [Bacteroidaceae bacterium]
MIKRVLISLAILLSVTNLYASVGEWRLHTSYHKATYCEIVEDKVYVLSAGALYSYNKEDDEIRIYDKISVLSDNNISFITYSKKEKALVIVYKNANIDLLYDDESVYNIPDFKNSTQNNKTINSVRIIDNTLYISTGFGIVLLDIDKKEFNNTYTLNKNVLCCYLFEDYIYAGTDAGLFRGKITDNLLDDSKWIQLNKYPTNNLEEFSDELYCVIKPLGLYTLDTNKNRLTLIIQCNDVRIEYLYKSPNELISGNRDKIFVVDKDKNYKTYELDGKSNFALKETNSVWNCKGYEGLVKCEINNGKIVEVSEGIQPNSPIRNHCEFMKFSGDKLLVAGGNLNYFDVTFYEGTVMEYNYTDDVWYNFPEEIIKEKTGLNYQNICCVEENPNEPGHYFASSFGYGLYEFKDGEFIAHYNNENSPLQSVISTGYVTRYVRIPKVKYDKNGNLWVINTGVKNIIKVRKKDNTWQSLYYKDIDKLPTVSDILFDSRGWIWLTSLQAEAGVFCIVPNKTPLDTSDDVTKGVFSKFTNQDGTSYDIYNIYTLIEDMNGEIWVGTNTGLFVIKNPRKFLDEGIFTQIKIPRNDGTGLADYLLNGVYIQCMAVDGANRKWIGTKDNGIYLISEDGLETIKHFTTDNSPLPSNGIVSVAINDQSGEVFIGTDNGIISYISDATKAETQLNENKIYAYPNPVKADYSGNITVVGLTLDCNVKIVDAAGYLIYEGTSNGGSFTWNGRNKNGDKVASGIYYVLAYDEEGNEGVATKIVIIR